MKKYVLYVVSVSLLMLACSKKQENINSLAAIQKNDELAENPLLMIPLASSIRPMDHTMSTLYGNEMAAEYAKTHSEGNYPQGSKLYEVTWKQKPDDVWFGGNVPEEILSVEKIVVDNTYHATYSLYKGRPLKRVGSKDGEIRLKYIMSQKMAVSP